MRTLGWAVFLAASWTWCIGMYLPALLMRDGGGSFFLAFLVPNVIGAASVGWVIGARRLSAAFVSSLRPVLVAFSLVTIAFHAYFLVWRVSEDAATGNWYGPGGWLLGVLLVLALAAARRRVDWLPACGALLCSLIAGAALVSFPITATASVYGTDLTGLAFVTALGFGLCPYLDLTFNRAAQHAPSPRAAFTIGFFVIFTATILLTTQGRVVWTPRVPPWDFPVEAALTAAGAHFGAQATFTVLAHASALRRTSASGDIAGPAPAAEGAAKVLWPALAFGAVVGVAAVLLPARLGTETGMPMDAAEIGYRGFLGAYGLIFPAWMLLGLADMAPLARRTILWLTVTCAVAMPFYLLGMIRLDEAWLIPGVLIVLVSAHAARLHLRMSR